MSTSPKSSEKQTRGIRLDGPKCQLLRKQKGWTQTQLATHAGISERSLRNAERGLAVSMTTLTVLAAVYDLTPIEIQYTHGPRFFELSISQPTDETLLANLDFIVCDLIREVANDPSIQSYITDTDSLHFQMEATAEGYIRLLGQHAKGVLQNRLQNTLKVELLHGPAPCPSPHALAHPGHTKKQVGALLLDEDLALVERMIQALQLQSFNNLPELLERYVQYTAELPEANIPQPDPVMRAELNPIQLTSAVYWVLYESTTLYDKGTLLALHEQHLLIHTIQATANRYALERHFGPRLANAFSSTLGSILEMDSNIVKRLLNDH